MLWKQCLVFLGGFGGHSIRKNQVYAEVLRKWDDFSCLG